jgi:hypothetical protein
MGALNLSGSNSNVGTGKVFLMIHDVGIVDGFDECIIQSTRRRQISTRMSASVLGSLLAGLAHDI